MQGILSQKGLHECLILVTDVGGLILSLKQWPTAPLRISPYEQFCLFVSYLEKRIKERLTIISKVIHQLASVRCPQPKELAVDVLHPRIAIGSNEQVHRLRVVPIVVRITTCQGISKTLSRLQIIFERQECLA